MILTSYSPIFTLGDGVNANYILKRANLYCDHSTVIVISERKNEQDYINIMKLGADKFIFKDEDVLKKRLLLPK